MEGLLPWSCCFCCVLFLFFWRGEWREIKYLISGRELSNRNRDRKSQLNRLVAVSEQKLLARSGKLCRNFTCPTRYFCCPGQVGKR